jgi:phospholipase/carboxylesterase
MRLFFALVFFISGFLHAQKIHTSLSYSVSAPAHITSSTPVLILLHGYGSSESDLISLAPRLDKRFLIFSLRAPYETKQGGYCWCRLDFLPDRQFAYDFNEAIKSRQMILSFISNACRAYKADSNNVFVLGFSQGAMMSFELALSAPSKLRGIIALSGRLMPESNRSSADWTKIRGLGFFIGHGTSDDVVACGDSEKAASILKSKKVPSVVLRKYPMRHAISNEELADISSWTGQMLSVTEKPAVQGRSK